MKTIRLVMLTCLIVVSNYAICATTFSKTNSLGQTIYYQVINSSSVYVIKPPSGSYQDLTGTVEIPNTVYYSGTTYTVSRIGLNAFKDCTGITEFDLPNYLEQINSGAFSGCTGLTFIDLPNTLTKLSGAFANCTNLQYVSMPSRLKSILGNAFENCTSLEYLEIPASVCKIEGMAFAGAGLSSFNVASNSTYYRVLSDGALVSYNGDTLIAYPPARNASTYNLTGSYHVIGTGAFYNNLYLQHVNLGDNIEQLCTSAFEGCNNMVSASLGKNVYNIQAKAFYNCISLEELTIKAVTPPDMASNSFNNVPRTCLVYVPCASMNAYHSNSTFIHFTNIEGLFDYSIEINVNDNTKGRVDILTEPTCEYPEMLLEAVPFTGNRFVKWSDNCPDAMRSIDVEDDVNLIAYFTRQTNDITTSVDTDALIYCKNNCINISLQHPQEIKIYDIRGCKIYEGRKLELSIPVNNGIYIVQTGIIKQKVVVSS